MLPGFIWFRLLQVFGGFTEHEAHAVYHEHIAPLCVADEAIRLRMLLNGEMGTGTPIHRVMLTDLPGL